MSSNNLFDEESSDEEDTAKSPVKQRVLDDDDDDSDSKEASAPKRTIEVDEDDDDDDDDEPAEKKKGGESKSTKKKKDQGKKKNMDLSSDDEDPKNDKVEYNPDAEEDEFDDDGANIVGKAAPRKPDDAPARVKQARPKFMTVLGSTRPPKDTSLHITKLPNLVGIQPEAFDYDTYSPELEEKEYNGYVHNMIRWRYKKDANGKYVRDAAGKLQRESNARIVKWDDGSMTLHVGPDVFAVDTIDSSKDGYPGLNGYLYLSQKATIPATDHDDEQPGGTVLECMGPITSKLVPRPSSLQSEAHKALTVAVRQKTVKRARIAEYVTQDDPEKMKQEKIRQNTDMDKQRARKSSSRGSNYRRPGMNRRYMEEEEEEENYDSVNLGNLKRRQFADDGDMVDYGDDDSEDDDDVGWTKGKLAAMREKKRQRKNDDSEEEFGVAAGDDSDEDEEAAPRARASKASSKKRQTLFDDEDD